MPGIILRRDTHDDAAVGVALVARILTHAIGHHVSRFRGGRHHRATGTHAKAVHRAAVAAVMHQFVIRRAQGRVSCVPAVAAAVDEGLGMLDAKTNGKRLGLQIHAALVQHVKRVARAMPHRQHDMPRRDVLSARQHHTQHLPAVDIEIADAAVKTYLATEGFNGRAQLLHHPHQPEGADVRLVEVENFRRRTGLNEFSKHLASVILGVLDLAVQLAIGKRAGTALAELHVGFRIEFAPAPQAEGVPGALTHRFAALQDDRTQAHLRQDQTGEEAAGSGADHHRTLRRFFPCLGHEVIRHVRGACHVGVAPEARQRCILVAQFNIHGVDQADDCRLARIHGATLDRELREPGFLDLQFVQQCALERGLGMVEGEFYFSQSQHGVGADEPWVRGKTAILAQADAPGNRGDHGRSYTQCNKASCTASPP